MTNTGARAGIAAPQLYVGMPEPARASTQPPLQLKGVRARAARARRDAGGCASRSTSARSRTGTRAANAWRVTPGCYRIVVGAALARRRRRGRHRPRRRVRRRARRCRATRRRARAGAAFLDPPAARVRQRARHRTRAARATSAAAGGCARGSTCAALPKGRRVGAASPAARGRAASCARPASTGCARRCRRSRASGRSRGRGPRAEVIVRPPREEDGEALARVHERGLDALPRRVRGSLVGHRPAVRRAAGAVGGLLPRRGRPDVGRRRRRRGRRRLSGRRAGGVRDVRALRRPRPARRGDRRGAARARRWRRCGRPGTRRATLWTFGASAQSTAFYERARLAARRREKDDRGFGATEVRYVREALCTPPRRAPHHSWPTKTGSGCSSTPNARGTPPATSRASATSCAVVPAPRFVSASVCFEEIAIVAGSP